MASRTSDYQYDLRINKVFDMLAMGAGRGEIVRFVTNEYDVGPRTADNYIAKANELFQKQSYYDRQEELGRALYRLNLVFSKAMKIQDYKTALAAQKELNTLLGLHAPKQIKIELVSKIVHMLLEARIDPDEFFARTLERLQDSN
jgi:hypothetical protein